MEESRFCFLMAGAAEEKRRCLHDEDWRSALATERDYWETLAKRAEEREGKL